MSRTGGSRAFRPGRTSIRLLRRRALQWDYYDLAVASPRVIGLLDFGFWTSPAWENGGAGAASLPQTVDSNERVAARILAAAG